MGSNDTGSDEKPVHLVYVDSFWIMRTEVTNAQYARCVEAGVCPTPNNNRWNGSDFADHPVTDVSWENAVAYTRWLSEESRVSVRLPTEAEWEKAARGTQGRVYPWGDDWDASRVNYCDSNCTNDGKDTEHSDGYALTAPVGSYAVGASPYGALDMAGNVWEWVSDWYSDSYVGAGQRNPTGPDSVGSRVLRGGSWDDNLGNVRSAIRYWQPPDFRSSYVGLRLVAPDR